MNWPEFDFVKYSNAHQERLCNAAKLSCDVENSRSKTCRSLTHDFGKVKSKKRRLIKEGNVNNICNQKMLSPSSPTFSERDSSQKSDEDNLGKLPPLSPILVNGFLREPSTISHTPLDKLVVGALPISMISMKKSSCNESSVSRRNNPFATSSQKGAITSPRSKRITVSNLNRVFAIRESKFVPDSKRPDASISFASADNDFTVNCNSVLDCCKEHNEADQNLEYLKSSSYGTVSLSTSISSDSSSSLLGTVPPSQCDRNELQENKSFSDVIEPLSTSSHICKFENSFTMKHSQSGSDVFQNYAESSSELSNVVITGELSSNSSFEVTMHETEANDPRGEGKVVVRNLPTKNQSRITDFWEKDAVEAVYPKQQHRLSKLAEALKRRMIVSSSDLAMWNCEQIVQQPVRQVVVVSCTEQWGTWWTIVKDLTNLTPAHIVDCKPFKKITEISSTKSRSHQVRNDNVGEGVDMQASSEQSLHVVYNLYHPLSWLNTPSGEVIYIAPRYYR